MTSKEALWCLLSNQKPLKNQQEFINLKTHENKTIGECVDIVSNSLDKLERYEKIIVPNLKKIIRKSINNLNQEELNMLKTIEWNHKIDDEKWESIWIEAQQYGVWVRQNNGVLYHTQPIPIINRVEICNISNPKDSDSKAPHIISKTTLDEENYGITWALTKEELE